jgi:D-inositol-3-phosphate glycosyltransferase
VRSPGERLHGLRWRLQAMRRLWRPGARPNTLFVRGIGPDGDGIGVLDSPLPGGPVGDEALWIKGWVGFRTGPTAKVEVWLDERPLGRARLGYPREDLVGLVDVAQVGVCGFELYADVGEPPASEQQVRVLATGPGGETVELGPVTVVPAEREPAAGGAPPAPVPPPSGARKAPRTLVVTHQLTLGGAQLYLMDLLKGLLDREAIEPVVLSSMDGPLRTELEAMGIPVHLTDLTPADSLAGHLGRVEELAAWAKAQEFELALINTATSVVVPAAEVAARLGIPAIWAIHESFAPQILWFDLHPEVRERAAATVSGAAAAVFEAEATRKIYAPLLDGGRGHVLPYGLDLEPIDRVRAGFDRAAARRAVGIPESAQLMVCVGTVEPRKAQVPLAQAFEAVAARRQDAQLAFVGGRREDPHSMALAQCIEESPHGRQMRLIPITPDVEDWYGMADLLVCASDVESLPRTVLEAMAWETPVLATSVFGLPELIEDGATGWLCEAGDVRRLVEGMDRVLAVPAEERLRVAERARALVSERHSLERYAERIDALVKEVLEGDRKASA